MAPSNSLPINGNEKTMNLNSLLLTNIQSSPYFKVKLYELKTYHEVIDEIYYKVAHLEPWEKGSRKTAGQTGMCGGVRGVGVGGIVSSAYCLLYKLFTLRLTRKQLMGLVTHADSPYIRGLGFMYIRYTQPPADLWEWYEEFLEDDDEIDVKAGGGHRMQIGEMLLQWMTKLEWYCTLFPRIPVPIQKEIEVRMREFEESHPARQPPSVQHEPRPVEPEAAPAAATNQSYKPDRNQWSSSPGGDRRRGQQSRSSPPFDIVKKMATDNGSRDARPRHRSSRSPSDRRDRPRDKHRHRSPPAAESRHRDKHSRSRGGDRRRSRSPRGDRHRDRKAEHRHRESSFDRDLRREKDRQERSHDVTRR